MGLKEANPKAMSLSLENCKEKAKPAPGGLFRVSPQRYPDPLGPAAVKKGRTGGILYFFGGVPGL